MCKIKSKGSTRYRMIDVYSVDVRYHAEILCFWKKQIRKNLSLNML